MSLNIKNFNKNKDILTSKLGKINIESVFIEQDGSTENFFYKKEKLHNIHSCAKMWIAMAVGVAIDRNLKINNQPLTLETKVYPFIKDAVNIINKKNLPKIKKWTIRNLLTHTTGYEKQMLSDRFIQDVDKTKLLEYALNFEIPFGVGNRYAYNNADPFIISVFFQEAFNINISDFVNENIFKKMGITDYKWLNYGKYCVASTGLFLKHTDFHKIGRLLINDGLHNQVQVIPATWIEEMCTLKINTPLEYKPERLFPKIGAGYYTFISRDGFVFRDGSGGQYMIVNKKNNLLITIFSSEPDMKNVTEVLRGLT